MTASAIFVSRLRGLPVLDSKGDQVGKVRDVVVQMRAGGRAPRCRGMVVELFARRRIFMPMIRVHAIDSGQVSISGTVDTRRFEQRESETLALDELVGLTVRRLDAKPEAIYDVAMKQVRNREWELSKVALREISAGSRLLGRRGHVHQVDWKEIPALSLKEARTTDALVEQLVDMKPADVARELHDLTPERRAEVAKALDDEQLANALEELPEDEQVELITELDTERAADVLEEMDPDDAADLIKELPEDKAEELLQRMAPDEARGVRNLMRYADFTAGAMMTPEPVIVGVDATVADGLARIRSQEVTPALASMVFLCRSPLDTPSGRYLGAVHFQRLLREPPSLMVAQMIDEALEPLRPEATLAEVSRYFATYNLVVAPVVNAEQQLVGALTVDDLLDHMLPADWRGDQMDGEVPSDEVPAVGRG